MAKINLQLNVELMPEDVQPKNSYRYRFMDGDNAVESIYIKRHAFSGKPPQKLTIAIRGEE
ncbi:hypothetical protein EVC26_010 [Rhizobium phage RHph_I72]|nr:hypothetical protein EVC13_010 [Rhizobium phage RHph_I65]QIG76456.1 hypothetical protein EVC26_010 [Rhizobium phage RHph_I72]